MSRDIKRIPLSENQKYKTPRMKTDIRFVDINTGEVSCSFNKCRTKFVPSYEKMSRSPKWLTDRDPAATPIEFFEFYHQCTECGRIQGINSDRSATIHSYESSIAGYPLDRQEIDLLGR